MTSGLVLGAKGCSGGVPTGVAHGGQSIVCHSERSEESAVASRVKSTADPSSPRSNASGPLRMTNAAATALRRTLGRQV